MERIRCVVCGLLLALGLSCCPVNALASDGFLGGLEDLVGTRDVSQDVDYERDYLDEYVPEVREEASGPVRALPEDATTVDYVNDTLDRFNRSGWSGAADGSLIGGIKLLFTQSVHGEGMVTVLTGAAIGLVFMWWGIRKATRIVMGSFRKGRASL